MKKLVIALCLVVVTCGIALADIHVPYPGYHPSDSGQKQLSQGQTNSKYGYFPNAY